MITSQEVVRADMEQAVGIGDNAVMLVSHPDYGNELNGMMICSQARQLLREHFGPLCLFHDASGTLNVNLDYLVAFWELDKELSGREMRVVCAVRPLLPRMMVRAYSLLSGRKWKIFKTRQGAEDFLACLGVDGELLTRTNNNVTLRKADGFIAA